SLPRRPTVAVQRRPAQPVSAGSAGRPATRRRAPHRAPGPANAGSIGGQNYTVVATLGGNYTGASDQADVNVHLPNQTNFITDGGYLVLTAAEKGIYAGDVGSKGNFGTNVKYNKSGTNLQGNVNIM